MALARSTRRVMGTSWARCTPRATDTPRAMDMDRGNGHGAATRPGDVARELISALWERSAPLITERLNGLDIACEAAVLGRLSPIMRRGAMDTAHKLAGSLGMFGYPRGTELAREIEQMLEYEGVVDAGSLRELVVELRGCLPL